MPSWFSILGFRKEFLPDPPYSKSGMNFANPEVAQNWVSSRGNFNPRSSEARKAAQDLQVAQFRGPKVAQIEVIPREYFNLSSFRIPHFVPNSGWPRIEVFSRGNSILSNFRICKVAQIEVFPWGNSILSDFRILDFTDFPTCAKELQNFAKSGFPTLLRLKTCPKESVNSG